jgi:hypothetical protein
MWIYESGDVVFRGTIAECERWLEMLAPKMYVLETLWAEKEIIVCRS